MIRSMDWSAEGYQLWMVHKSPTIEENRRNDSILQMDFVKSALTVNPCMVGLQKQVKMYICYFKIKFWFCFQSHSGHLYLQGEDRLYINLGDGITKVYNERARDASSNRFNADSVFIDPGNFTLTNTLMGSKQWIIVPLPAAYSATNWPIRVCSFFYKIESAKDW